MQGSSSEEDKYGVEMATTTLPSSSFSPRIFFQNSLLFKSVTQVDVWISV